MSPFFLFFLLFEAVILVIGVLLGLKRGLGKTLVRVVYLLLIGVASFFLSKFVVSRAFGSIMEVVRGLYPADLKTLIANAPEIEVMLQTFASALIIPVCFALIFFVLELLSLIGFGTIAKKIVSKIAPSAERTAAGKWSGAAVGLLASVFVAAVLLSPMYMAASIVSTIPEETLATLGIASNDVAEVDGVEVASSGVALRNNVWTGKAAFLANNGDFDFSSLFFLSSFLVDNLTTFETPQGEKTSVTQEIPLIMDMATTMIHAYNVTQESGGDQTDAIMNAASVLVLYVDDSPFVKELTSSAVSSIGKSLEQEQEIFGGALTLPEDEALKPIVDSLITTLAETSTETVKDNLTTLFGVPSEELIPESKKDPLPPAEIPGDTTTNASADTPNDDAKPNDSTADNKPAETPDAKPSDSTADNKPGETPDAKPSNTPENTNKPITNKGLLSAFTKMGDSADEGSEEADKKQEIITNAFANMSDNAAMKGVLSEVTAYVSQVISASSTSLVDESTKVIYEEIVSQINSLSYSLKGVPTKEKIQKTSEVLSGAVSEFNLSISDWQITVVATCAVDEFLGDKYPAGVTIADIMGFFGVAASQIPDWAN